MSLELYLPEDWCSATVYLLWCPRQTGCSLMATFCLQSCVSSFSDRPSRALHISPWLRHLFSHPWTCVALLVTLSPNMVNTAAAYGVLTMRCLRSLMSATQTIQLFLLPPHNTLREGCHSEAWHMAGPQ